MLQIFQSNNPFGLPSSDSRDSRKKCVICGQPVVQIVDYRGEGRYRDEEVIKG